MLLFQLAMVSLLVSGISLIVVTPILVYRQVVVFFCTVGGTSRKNHGDGSHTTTLLILDAFVYWLSIVFLHIFFITTLHFKLQAQVSDYIDEGVTIIKSYVRDSTYVGQCSTSKVVSLPNAQTWEPEISVYSLTRVCSIFPPHAASVLGGFAALHAFGFSEMLVLLPGPQPGHPFYYGFFAFVAAAITIMPLLGAHQIFKHNFLEEELDFIYSQRLCQEIMEMMGMDSFKMAGRFQEAFRERKNLKG
ncbi:hypothetical protein BDP27DRAFT_1357292 [Rhodocollybia butyracea]|uniref:Uncharacterized protein n=1 Tax=Rhodocollybia butyracea TaxID=206335 RepID=A0A9P5UFD0_9AGAR|nr:hypothetical protein BDP27DRAFT_1357292 [Rhodocollybia butyracea]